MAWHLGGLGAKKFYGEGRKNEKYFHKFGVGECTYT